MASQLVRTREHLGAHRRLIIGHALAAAFAGRMPLPYLDEWLPSVVRRQLVRRLAEARGVDVDDEALREIADGRVSRPSWRDLTAVPVSRLLRGGLRRALLALNLYRRAEAANRIFVLGTLFDHYCARQHVGGELDGAAGRALRERIDAVASTSAGSLPRWAVRRAFVAGLRRLARAPLVLLDSLRGARDTAEAEDVVEESLAAAEARGALGRATSVVERQLAAVGRSYVDALVDAFERRR